MIPKTGAILQNGFQIQQLETNTYRLDMDHDRIFGWADGLEAIKQTIYLILNIERYEYLIYSWNYGLELKDLFGKPIPFVLPELKRRISEALLQDDRINAVEDFDFIVQRNKVNCTFRVATKFGDVPTETVVMV